MEVHRTSLKHEPAPPYAVPIQISVDAFPIQCVLSNSNKLPPSYKVRNILMCMNIWFSLLSYWPFIKEKFYQRKLAGRCSCGNRFYTAKSFAAPRSVARLMIQRSILVPDYCFWPTFGCCQDFWETSIWLRFAISPVLEESSGHWSPHHRFSEGGSM